MKCRPTNGACQVEAKPGGHRRLQEVQEGQERPRNRIRNRIHRLISKPDGIRRSGGLRHKRKNL